MRTELDLSIVIFWFAIMVLTPMTVFFESMRQLAYLSSLALASITAALLYILYTDLFYIKHPTVPRTLDYFNIEGVPYFFGIALFMFEGNALALEIYQQTEDAPTRFPRALQHAIVCTATLITLVGGLSYAAYG